MATALPNEWSVCCKCSHTTNRNTKSKWFLFHIFIARNKLLLKASTQIEKTDKMNFSQFARAFSSRSGHAQRMSSSANRCGADSVHAFAFFACTYETRFPSKISKYRMIFRMRQTQQLKSFIVSNRFLYLLLSWIVDGFHPHVCPSIACRFLPFFDLLNVPLFLLFPTRGKSCTSENVVRLSCYVAKHENFGCKWQKLTN